MRFLSTKNILVFTLVLVVAIVSLSEPSRLVLFFGRFHPLILHLPIGALILTLFIDIVGRIKNNYPSLVIQYALGFSSFFAVLACVLGYFLSFEGGYDEGTLNIHLWVGVISAILIIGLFLLSKNEDKKASKLFLPCFIITFIFISVAGHYGSVLTHGSDFLTQYAKTPPKVKAITNTDSLRVFNDVVFKILDAKCIQCHNTTKRKGELSLNSPENILKGGENGDVIKKGNAHESAMFKSILLPLSDEKHMPPEGKPQLTKDDLWLIEYWINNNANFKDKVVNLPKSDTLNRLLKKFLVFDEVKIKEASITLINKAKEAGFAVLKLVPNKPELSVKFQKGELTQEALKKIVDLREQIVELDLSNTVLTDAMSISLKKFKNLKKLSLSNTKITDESLKDLYNAKALKTLNLYNTGITENGLNKFLEQVVPEDVFVWKTEIKKESVAMFEDKYKVKIHAGADDDFVEITNLEVPSFLSDKNLFVDTISVKLVSKINNIKTYYTIDGTVPDSTSLKYKDKIFLDNPVQLKVRTYKKGWLPSDVLEKNFFRIKHEILKYQLVNQPDDRYPSSAKLFDLKEGSDFFRDGNWTGFSGDNIDATIDLETIKSVDKISINCLENVSNWILFPKKIAVYSSTNISSGFKKIGELKITRTGRYGDGTVINKYTVDVPNTKTQFLRVVVENFKKLPKWHEGAGTDAWLFVDEILIH